MVNLPVWYIFCLPKLYHDFIRIKVGFVIKTLRNSENTTMAGTQNNTTLIIVIIFVDASMT